MQSEIPNHSAQTAKSLRRNRQYCCANSSRSHWRFEVRGEYNLSNCNGFPVALKGWTHWPGLFPRQFVPLLSNAMLTVAERTILLNKSAIDSNFVKINRPFHSFFNLIFWLSKVHLSMASTDRSIMGVSWVSLNQPQSVVQYGTSATDLSQSSVGSITTYKGGFSYCMWHRHHRIFSLQLLGGSATFTARQWPNYKREPHTTIASGMAPPNGAKCFPLWRWRKVFSVPKPQNVVISPQKCGYWYRVRFSGQELTFGIIGDMDYESNVTIANMIDLVEVPHSEICDENLWSCTHRPVFVIFHPSLCHNIVWCGLEYNYFRMLWQAGKVNCIIHPGDISYADGYEPHWDVFFRRIERIAARVPYMVRLPFHLLLASSGVIGFATPVRSIDAPPRSIDAPPRSIDAPPR